MTRPTQLQEFTAGAVALCAACWLAVVWGAISWWRGDINDELAGSMARHPAGKGQR